MICGKVIYSSRDQAKAAINGLKSYSNSNTRSNKQPSQTYLCNECNGWHLYTENSKPRSNKNGFTREILTLQIGTFKGTLIIHEARKFKIK